MQKNVASQKIGAQMVSATDGSAFTSAVTVHVTGDAGTQAAGSVGSGACTHEGNGYHTYAPAQAETNYTLVAFTFVGTGAVPATVQVFTTGYDPTVASLPATLSNSVTHGGTAAKLELGSSTSTPAFLVQNSGGDAMQLTASGGNGDGLHFTGHGTGHGIRSIGGATGDGLLAGGGATSGHGFRGVGQGGGSGMSLLGTSTSAGFIAAASGTGNGFSATANDGHGFFVQGGGTSHHGIRAEGGGGSGDGINAIASTSGHGLSVTGIGTTKHGISATGGATSSAGISAAGGGDGAGILSTGGATGDGIMALGGATSGDGVLMQAATSGAGLRIYAGGSNSALYIESFGGNGITSVAEGEGHGLFLDGDGDGHGLFARGGATGHGIRAQGGTSSGDGISAVAATDGDGIDAVGAATGVDIRGDITGNLTGTIDGLTATALKDFFDTNSTTTYASAVAGSVVKEIADNAGGTSLTVADIVDGVWDEDATGHQTQGSFGQAIGDPGADADTIWALANTNLNATVSSRATQTSVDDLPTNAELATALGTADDAVLAAIAALNNLSQANIRTAVGLGSANLDTQLDALPTNAELATALGTADDAVLAAIAALNNLSSAQAQTAAAAALTAYDPPTRAEATSDKDEILTSVADVPTNAELATALAAADDAVLAAIAALNNLSSAQVTAAVPTAVDNADALLKRDFSSVTGEATRSALNALRFLRNKWGIVDDTLTITKEDDTTTAWTATVAKAASNPVHQVDPD